MENAIYILSLEEGIVHRSDTSYGIHTSRENALSCRNTTFCRNATYGTSIVVLPSKNQALCEYCTQVSNY